MTAIAVLLADGARAIVWTASLGAVVFGLYVVIRRWGERVDLTLLLGIAAAVAGSGVFGYAVNETSPDGRVVSAGDEQSSPSTPVDEVTSPPTSSARSSTTTSSVSSTKSTNTTSPPSTVPLVQGRYLSELSPVPSPDDDYEEELVAGEWTVNGTTFGNSMGTDLRCYYKVARVDYNIDRQYQRFRASVGVSDDSEAAQPVDFIVEVDGVERVRRSVSLGDVSEIDLSVENAFRLSLYVDEPDGTCTDVGSAVWGDARLE